MNQFTVPQFIDVEDKIFGPITTRQFIILLVAGLILFVAFKLADTALFVVLLAIIGGLALTLAFVKINGQPFHYFLLNIIQTLRRPSRRVWCRRYTTDEIKSLQITEPSPPEAAKPVKRISYNRLRDLSLLVNTGGYYHPEEL
ncbi:MAG: PrgI family protein [Candidatus Magasanikbacteria bacterium]|nr:PrgI family protein [Candidatus Magasanikbacteria bacterium]